MSRLSLRRSPQNMNNVQTNPMAASHMVKIGPTIGRSGPDLIWHLHSAIDVNTKQECTAFVCDKKFFDRNNKHRRREIILEVLRNEVVNINRLKHTRFIQLLHEMEENGDFLTYVTEPLIGSLYDLFAENENLKLTELEIIFGVYQITDALRYLHSTQDLMHCNINLAAILVTTTGLWKLGGLNFLESIVDTTKVSPKFTGYSVKIPRCAQPNLDFVAPEAQLYNSMSPLADMFSLGMVVCALYNRGHSLIESDHNPSVYVKRIAEIPKHFVEISEHLPKALVEPVRKMISEDVRKRPTSQLFALLKVFNEPVVLSYEGLLTLECRSLNQKKEFFNRFAKVVPQFEPVIRYDRLLPLLLNWYEDSMELAPFVLPSIMAMIKIAEAEDYEKHLKVHLVKILNDTKPLQISIVIIDLLELFIDRISQDELIEIIIPELFVCLEPATPKSLETVFNAVAILPNYLDEKKISQFLLPQFKTVIQGTSSSSKTKIACLECLEILLKYLSYSTIAEFIIPFVSSIQTIDRELICAILNLNRQLISDRRHEISYYQIADKLLPALVGLLTIRSLTNSDFRTLMDVIRIMLDQVDRQRSLELRSQGVKHTSGSCSDMSASIGITRNLPLISMQRPTMDTELMSTDDDNKLSHLSLSDYRRSSGSDVNNTRRWSRNSLLLQRLQASKHRSESLLFNLRQRNSTPNAETRMWNETASNPTFTFRGQSSAGSRVGGISPFYVASPSSGNVPIFRRYSGNLPTRSIESQENLGSLNVPRINGGLLDPRRHSYGCSPTTSTKSLITVNVCEGPFVTPLNYRNSIRRTSTRSVQQVPQDSFLRDNGPKSPRRSSLNLISDLLVSTFKKVL